MNKNTGREKPRLQSLKKCKNECNEFKTEFRNTTAKIKKEKHSFSAIVITDDQM